MTTEQRQLALRRTEIGAQVGAAALGTGLGAAKLRDSFKEDHRAAFNRGLGHLHSGARRAGASPATARKLVRVANVGKPHFAQITAGAGAAALATGLGRYRSLTAIEQQRKTKPVRKSAFGVQH